ncbi:RagB/SusD family nutrient uptake outer membrane protein [Sphingobacterium faecium]|uniref:RagB/SusD family nutrient uptake outer membrane protein n=1 Tax=Sphingobacterium faecium TaxID=34087 RepID=UPI003209CB18
MKYYIIFLLSIGLSSCSKFLELKPDQNMEIPSTLADCELLLNDFTAMNASYAVMPIMMGEEFYFHTEDWQTIVDMDERMGYIWSDEPVIGSLNWQGPYKTIYVCNQIFAIYNKLSQQDKSSEQGKLILGNAHFFRAFAYQQLLELYTLPYDPATASNELGLPLKLTPDVVPAEGRASLSATYDQVVQDYKQAVSLLKPTSIAKSRPTKGAAQAGLSRLYLDMRDYEKAYLYADSAWTLQPTLIDYNILDPYDEMAIPKNNQEIYFTALTGYSESIGPYSNRINPDLIDLYEADDLRISIYFQYNDFDPGTYGYKTNYDQSYIGTFIGLTTSEMLLIRSEAAARIGKSAIALAGINLLRKHRFAPEDYQEVHWGNDILLEEILKERRRELVFRGRRWADVKRLNQDAVTQRTLTRNIDGQSYQLVPGSPKFAALIPQIVTQLNPTIQQNRR